MFLSPVRGRGEERGRRSVADQILDGSPNALGILNDLICGKPNNTPAFTLHHRRPVCVGLELIGMMVAIDFDHDLLCHTSKVCKVAADRMLAPKLCSVQPVSTEQFPAQTLGATAVAPELPCSLDISAQSPSPTLSP